MKNYILYLLLILSVLALPFCTTSKKLAGGKVSVPTYTVDVAPVIATHCTPCHFPDTGKKKFLDTYGAVSSTIDEILHRVQLPQDSLRFMPFKAKKEPLSDSLINVLKLWKEGGMAE